MTSFTPAILSDTITQAVSSVQRGGGPFAATLVAADGTHYTATNTVTADNDPTAHAEVNAIRAAAADQGFDLSGSTLYSSCSPCPMCLAAAMWARVDTVVWAASSAQAMEAGFDDSTFHQQFRTGQFTSVQLIPNQLTTGEAFLPFAAWKAHEGRVEY